MDEGKKMKKTIWFVFLMFQVILMVLIYSHFVSAKELDYSVRFDFQFTDIQAKSNTQNIYCSFGGRLKRDKVELVIDNEVIQSKIDDEMDNDRQFSSFQVNHYLDKSYLFFNNQFLTDKQLGIDDEFSYGLGIGYKNNPIEAQIGCFNRSKDHSNDDIFTVAKGSLILTIPLKDPKISLVLNNGGEIDTNDFNNYRVNNVSSVRIALNEFMKFSFGYAINYKHLNEPGDLNTTRRYFSGIALEF